MKCPECKTGEIFLYKETVKEMEIPLNKNNTLGKNKKKWVIREFDTEKEYLECKECTRMFDYYIDDKQRVVLDGIKKFIH